MESSEALVKRVLDLLRSRGETLSCAESCTGGLLSSWITALPGVSDVFMGSIVAYANDIKQNVLRVPLELLIEHGAVSLPVASAMASGAKTVCQATWALSITGVAGPSGGSAQKPVGLVCFGLAGPGIEKTDQQFFEGDRREIQSASAAHALRLLLNELGMDEGPDSHNHRS